MTRKPDASDPAYREDLVCRVVGYMRRAFPHLRGGYCMHWTSATVAALNADRLHAVLRAGSAAWPRVPPAQLHDDHNHLAYFGYRWHADHPFNLTALLIGQLPEVHTWAWLVYEEQFVDLSVGFWPEECEFAHKLDWPGEKPPTYLWCDKKSLPKHVIYIPDREAEDVVKQIADAKDLVAKAMTYFENGPGKRK